MTPSAFVESFQETARGSLLLREHPSGLTVAVVKGHYGIDLLPRYMRALAEAAKTGRALGFHDWEAMESYDSECRRRMTQWTIQNRTRLAAGHILVKHRIVAMGVATGSLLVGAGLVKTYFERAEFEAALEESLPADARVRSAITSLRPPSSTRPPPSTRPPGR